MKFAHFAHVWNKAGMSPAQRYQQLWRELQVADELGSVRLLRRASFPTR